MSWTSRCWTASIWVLMASVAWACGTSAAGADDDAGAGDDDDLPAEVHPSCLEDTNVIHQTPSSHTDYLQYGMSRYATVEAPGGGLIYIYAQDEVSEAQIRRARNLLRFFLTDVAGSLYGDDKSAVANAMADNQAVLMMPNGAHIPGQEPELQAQPLFADETPVEGSSWYMESDWEHRDAAFEEIFHLVHDAGIGTWLPGALPAYQAELDAEARLAIEDGRWGIPIEPEVEDWLEELEQEGSLAQEYIAAVLDSYYGLWGAWDETPGGMWGIYIAKTRAQIEQLDPNGLALLEAFLPPYLTQEVRLDEGFAGMFSLRFDDDAPYTHKSRYLTWVTLTGSHDSGLQGNDADNTLRGNAGDNQIDGGAGDDTVVYCRDRADVQLSVQGISIVVDGPDGRDSLQNVEWIHFNDVLVDTAALRDE